MSAILELHKTSKVYKGGLFRSQSTAALREVTLSLGEGKPMILSIAGESGSGKTTLGMLLLGFINPSEGKVLYKGQDLWQAPKPVWKEFRREVQAIFQDPFEVFNPFYPVDYVMNLPLSKFKLAPSKAERRSLMEAALQRVGLRPEEILGRYPHQLSGGQRQRIIVARALMLQPKIIIADEPVSMVDASLRATILKSLSALRDELGISILYITHDLTTAYHISDYIVILYQGEIVEAGEVTAVITRPQHPYTQLLVGSIPWPDPSQKWGESEAPGKSRVTRPSQGCSFSPRCPHVMEICKQQEPGLYRTKPNQAVACFQYNAAPMLAKEQIQNVLNSNNW
jgi:peptide/nickel transport system ATP-binding protein